MNVINFLTTIWILYKINFQQLLTQNKKKDHYTVKNMQHENNNNATGKCVVAILSNIPACFVTSFWRKAFRTVLWLFQLLDNKLQAISITICDVNETKSRRVEL